MSTYEKIKPSVFVGSSTWHTLQCYAASYVPTPKNRVQYKQWIYNTLNLFPCKECRDHAMISWKRHNIDHYMQNADRLYLYVSAVLHDGANDFKGVPLKDRPNYYEHKKWVFESMHGSCAKCK